MDKRPVKILALCAFLAVLAAPARAQWEAPPHDGPPQPQWAPPREARRERPEPGPDGRWLGNLNLFLGDKSLDRADWYPAEQQLEGGLSLDFQQARWPVAFAVEIFGSSGKGTAQDLSGNPLAVKGRTSELGFGVKKIWDGFPYARPFVGAGLDFIRASFDVAGPAPEDNGSDTNSGAGLWFGTGVYWTLGQNVNLGFLYRYSDVRMSLLGANVNAGGSHFGMVLGLHWGGRTASY